MSQNQTQTAESVIRREEVQAGLIKEVIREGNGKCLEVQDQVTVHCTGMLDGPERKVFWRYVYMNNQRYSKHLKADRK